MFVEYLFQDIVTVSISYVLFWAILIFIILYPKLRLKKIQKRIQNLEKNIK